jgi:Flp pilus assembly pilin Flp
MKRVLSSLGRLLRKDGGQDLIEYALLAALITLGAVAGVSAAGNAINTVLWQGIASTLSQTL